MTNTHADHRSVDADNPDGVADDEFKPLTAEEANQWRRRNPSVSPWWVIGMQVVVALVVGGLHTVKSYLSFSNILYSVIYSMLIRTESC